MERKIDELGRVVLPIEFRKEIGLDENNSTICLELHNGKIIISKAVPSCVFCNVAVELVKISGKCVCINCISRLKDTKVGDMLY